MAVNKVLVNQRLAMIMDFFRELESLSSLSKNEFLDVRNAASAESFLRRSLEAIFDVGRHILAKNDGVNMSKEYKSIARGLFEKNIIGEDLSEKMIKMAGYRNRMVHLYHQVSDEELYQIISHHLADINNFVQQIKDYIK